MLWQPLFRFQNIVFCGKRNFCLVILTKFSSRFCSKQSKSFRHTYLVFFKARDADALTSAFKEYTTKTDRKKERPSVLKKLRRFKEAAVDIDTPKVRKKELDAR